MTQFARLHRVFEDVTGFSKQLNEALLVAKRVAGRTEPEPADDKHQSAAKVIVDVLHTLLESRDGGLKRPWVADALEELSRALGRSDDETRAELEAILGRTGKGLRELRPEDLRLLDQLGTVLDRSSAALYRQLIRV